mgnify:FL=1
MNFFVWRNLKTLNFPTAREADLVLRKKALEDGFEITARDSTKVAGCRYYCRRGGRKRGDISNKIDCPFFFKTMAFENQDGSISIRISEKNICLNHNHQLKPQRLTVKILNEEILQIVRDMLHSDIPPSKIRKFLYNKGVINISTLQIRLLDTEKPNSSIVSESDELIEYLENNDGFYEPFEKYHDGVNHRLALFTMTKDEENNLRNFGDVIFIDGTQVKLTLKWEVIPITVIDKNKNIRCGGILYASLFTEEVIIWLLETLLKLDFMKHKLETMITDEDAAFIVAFKKVFDEEDNKMDYPVKHILCALHKTRNFIKKINSLDFSKSEKESFEQYFDCICYSFDHDKAMKNLGKLLDVKKLRRYLQKEIIPYLHMFARSCIDGAHCLGYNVTSPAESMNSMLKRSLPDRMLTLLQSRLEFNQILDNHLMLIEEKIETKRVPKDSILFKKYMPKIADEIREQIKKAKSTTLVPESFEYYTHKSWSNEHPDEIYRLNEWFCNCGFIDFSGLPCCHIIALHANLFNEFPTFLVDPRWNRTNETFKQEDSLLFEQTLKEADATSDDDEEVNLPPPISYETNDSNEMSNLSQGERFLKLFHVSKSICSLASESVEHSNDIAIQFKGILNTLRGMNSEHNQNNEQQDVDKESTATDPQIKTIDHVDEVGKLRGRPPKIRKAKEHTKIVECSICLKKHLITDCEFYEEYTKLLSEAPDEVPGKRRCGLCRHYDHTIRTCPLRLKATTNKS